MTAQDMKQAVSLLLARATSRFGGAGWLGLALCTLGLALLLHGWVEHQTPLPALDEPALAAPVAVTRESDRVEKASLALAGADHQALLLIKIQQIATSEGLGWASADYKLVSATESVPETLEVRCTLKGPYPRLRSTLAQWLQQVPGLAIRDLALSRSSSEISEVEAKLHLVVFMRTQASEVRP